MQQVVVISHLAVLSQHLYGVTEDNHTIHKHMEQSVSQQTTIQTQTLDPVRVHTTMLSAVRTVSYTVQQL